MAGTPISPSFQAAANPPSVPVDVSALVLHRNGIAVCGLLAWRLPLSVVRSRSCPRRSERRGSTPFRDRVIVQRVAAPHSLSLRPRMDRRWHRFSPPTIVNGAVTATHAVFARTTAVAALRRTAGRGITGSDGHPVRSSPFEGPPDQQLHYWPFPPAVLQALCPPQPCVSS